ncbi:hypothetical protein BC739_005321 [Kutzneria viridogrisea]|uniref:PucR C-terminal helix-turn-helix domain-containing protein n=1 Tax=Kutzneria viridogrisea TaxID=47990 RepID=A0ABR6BNE4_9PSEU|nr:hypothetical protein [Kutzneria viridogrisea]
MGSPTTSKILGSFPLHIASLFRPYATRLSIEVLREIQRGVPEYNRPVEGKFGRILTEAVRQSILHCIDSVGNPNVPQGDWANLYKHVGKIEFHEGRPLECVQTAYRIGTRVAWRRCSQIGQAQGLATGTLCRLAEAIFAYCEEISVMSAEGYAEARTQASGAKERMRRRLIEVILCDPGALPRDVAQLAEEARWPLPTHLSVVVVEPKPDHHGIAAPTLPDQVIHDLDRTTPVLLTADPERDLVDLASALPGWRAAVGPRVRLTEAAASQHWAGRAIGLVQRGLLPDVPLTWCRDHLSTLWLLADELLMNELAKQSLAPLRGLTVKQRARMVETLAVWLETGGSAPKIAERLEVHPQTVRYRLRKLDELFGARLRNSHDRFEMEVALRAQHLLGDRTGDVLDEPEPS